MFKIKNNCRKKFETVGLKNHRGHHIKRKKRERKTVKHRREINKGSVKRGKREERKEINRKKERDLIWSFGNVVNSQDRFV